MEPLRPITVTPRDSLVWLRESAILARRKLVSAGLLTVTYAALTLFTTSDSILSVLLGALLCQLYLTGMMLVAEAADHSRSVHEMPIGRAIREVAGFSILLSVAAALIVLTVAVVFQPVIESTAESVAQVVSHEPPWLLALLLTPALIALSVFGVGIAWLHQWFVYPLLVHHELRLKEAMRLALRAQALNTIPFALVVVVPILLLNGLMIIWENAALLLLPVLPIAGALMYVSYRHVFLGRRDNAPVRVRTAVGAAQPTA